MATKRTASLQAGIHSFVCRGPMKTVVWLRRYCQTLGTIVALLTIGFWVACAADDEKGDSTSEAKPSSTIQTPHVATLFDDEVLADNVFAVRQKAKQRLAVARYESLRGWVLPSKSHRDFRLAGKQTSTDPVAPLIDDHRFELERQRAGMERGDRGIRTGGIRPQNCGGPTEWDRLITTLMGRIKYQELPPAGQSRPWTAAPDLKFWHWVSGIHSWGNGNGIPLGHLKFSKGTLKTLAYMDDEFLFFGSPLRATIRWNVTVQDLAGRRFFHLSRARGSLRSMITSLFRSANFIVLIDLSPSIRNSRAWMTGFTFEWMCVTACVRGISTVT